VNARVIAAIVVFAALAIMLNLSPFKIPAPYAPFLIYQIWEIPIVAAFLLFGARVGILITLINTLALIALFPGALPTGPLYNMLAVLSMLTGVGLTKFFFDKHSPKHEVVMASIFTASGTILRALFMVLVNYALLRYPPPVGYSMPEGPIIAMMPLVAIFNVTLALYTIPIGFSLARIVKSSVKALMQTSITA
jgi:riboflavin transporter FmnP